MCLKPEIDRREQRSRRLCEGQNFRYFALFCNLKELRNSACLSPSNFKAGAFLLQFYCS